MSTPFVELQKVVVTILQIWFHDQVRFPLRDFAKRYCIDRNPDTITQEDMSILSEHGLCESSWSDYIAAGAFYTDLTGILIEQIDVSAGLDGIKIRNLLGSQLYHYEPVGFETYIKQRGRGYNNLRTDFCCMPGVLKKGDILATGETVVELPREGGNGSVLVCLGTSSEDKHRVWLGLPARIPLALLAVAGDPPPAELVE